MDGDVLTSVSPGRIGQSPQKISLNAWLFAITGGGEFAPFAIGDFKIWIRTGDAGSFGDSYFLSSLWPRIGSIFWLSILSNVFGWTTTDWYIAKKSRQAHCVCRDFWFYSADKASIGLSFAARRAGKSAARSEMIRASTKAVMTSPVVTWTKA